MALAAQMALSPSLRWQATWTGAAIVFFGLVQLIVKTCAPDPTERSIDDGRLFWIPLITIANESFQRPMVTRMVHAFVNFCLAVWLSDPAHRCSGEHERPVSNPTERRFSQWQINRAARL
jgi:hypothetical protein